MARVKKIHLKFLGQRVGPMRTLTRDECVDALGSRFGDLRSTSASDDPDAPSQIGSAGREMHRASHSPFEMVAQHLAIDFRVKSQPDRLTTGLQKRRATLKSHRSRKQGVVPDAGMNIEREVGAVDRHVPFH